MRIDLFILIKIKTHVTFCVEINITEGYFCCFINHER